MLIHNTDTGAVVIRVGDDAVEVTRAELPDVVAHLASYLDPDRHDFTPNADEPEARVSCGDDASANDHQPPEKAARVWMDVEGLTAADVDRLDALVADGFPAEAVAAWAAVGGDYASADGASQRLAAWLATERCGCCGSYGDHPEEACPEWHDRPSTVPPSEVPELFPSEVSDVAGRL